MRPSLRATSHIRSSRFVDAPTETRPSSPVLAGQITTPSPRNEPDATSAATSSGRRYATRAATSAPRNASRSGAYGSKAAAELGRDELRQRRARGEMDLHPRLDEALDEALPVHGARGAGDADRDAHGSQGSFAKGGGYGPHRPSPRIHTRPDLPVFPGRHAPPRTPTRAWACGCAGGQAARRLENRVGCGVSAIVGSPREPAGPEPPGVPRSPPRSGARSPTCASRSTPTSRSPEIHRRVIAAGGPALLFHRPRGAAFPLVTNLFGTPGARRGWPSAPARGLRRTRRRGARGAREPLASAALGACAASCGQGAQDRHEAAGAAARSPRSRSRPTSPRLPVTTSWHWTAGPFFTLPLVYTEHPATGKHNLGMYRMQVHDAADDGDALPDPQGRRLPPPRGREDAGRTCRSPCSSAGRPR